MSSYLGNNNNDTTANESGFTQSEPVTVYFSVGSVGQIRFATTESTVREDGKSVDVRVTRVGGADGRLTVNFATADQTATAGADYSATSGTLVFADLERKKPSRFRFLMIRSWIPAKPSRSI